jgi:small subunit ribosomal protein S9
MDEQIRWHAVGKRKTSVARVWAVEGTGRIIVNDRKFEEYFPVDTTRMVIEQPLQLTDKMGQLDFKVRVRGGGPSGQAGAIKHGITKVLLEIDPELRDKLKKAGFITRDPRIKERKKYGRKKARKSFQYSKR